MVLSRDYTYTVSERHSIFFRLMDTRERERERGRERLWERHTDRDKRGTLKILFKRKRGKDDM